MLLGFGNDAKCASFPFTGFVHEGTGDTETGTQLERHMCCACAASSCLLNEEREPLESEPADPSASAAPLPHPAFAPPPVRQDEVVLLVFFLSACGFCHRGTARGQRREEAPERPDGPDPTPAERR